MSKTGHRIALLRKENGLSQAGLVKIVGISREAVGKYERGEASASIETAKKIADAFQVTLDHLVDDTAAGTFDKKTVTRIQELRTFRSKNKITSSLSSMLFCGMLRLDQLMRWGKQPPN